VSDTDDVNLLEDNIGTVKKSTETVIDASEDIGLEVNTEQTRYMLLSHHQYAGKIITKRPQTDNLKMCHSSNIWE
jgi:hypothetical protein